MRMTAQTKTELKQKKKKIESKTVLRYKCIWSICKISQLLLLADYTSAANIRKPLQLNF